MAEDNNVEMHSVNEEVLLRSDNPTAPAAAPAPAPAPGTGQSSSSNQNASQRRVRLSSREREREINVIIVITKRITTNHITAQHSITIDHHTILIHSIADQPHVMEVDHVTVHTNRHVVWSEV